MPKYQFIAGTDAACIGLWDRKWSGPSIREKSVSKFLNRLPLDAEQKRVFYINTGGDGQFSTVIYVDDQIIPDNRYKNISTGYSIDIDSGEAVFDGLESYGSDYKDKNILSIDKGTYSIDLYELNDPEMEESTVSQIGPSRKPHILERFVFLGGLTLVLSIFLFIQKKYLFASILFLLTLAYSILLGKIQKQAKLNFPVKYKTEIKVPFLIVCLKKISDTSIKGGHVSLV